MKKAIFATTILSAALAACGTAPSGVDFTAPSGMESNERYITDASGNMLLSGASGECVENAAWAKDEATVGCHTWLQAEAEAPAPVVEAPAPAAPVYESIKVSANALFAFDSAVVTSAGRSKLNELAQELRGFHNINDIIVVGHTDSVGSSSYNQGLSERRAEAVRAYLSGTDLGVSITATGKGESSPIASNNTSDGRAQNRRVEVLVSGSRKAN